MAVNGGGRGIRTPGTVSRTAVFKTATLSHSVIPPHIVCSSLRLDAFRLSLICLLIRGYRRLERIHRVDRGGRDLFNVEPLRRVEGSRVGAFPWLPAGSYWLTV
jgi:hypothetical protein